MQTKKIPISFNKDEQEEIQENADLFGLGVIDRDYGTIPRAVKASITFSKELPKLLEKFIPDLEPEKLDILFTSIKRLKLDKYKAHKIEEIGQKDAKV